jgi:hypothetical protein
MKYILVTFYLDHREGKTIWHVYGHVAPGINESLGEYNFQPDAIGKAFEFCVPVMLGRSYEAVLKKLSALPEE